MKANVGLADRNVRIIVGVLLVGSNLFNYYVLGNPYCPWANLGWIPLLTGLFRWCPIYTLLGKSTVKQ